jgi:hypothetical protein
LCNKNTDASDNCEKRSLISKVFEQAPEKNNDMAHRTVQACPAEINRLHWVKWGEKVAKPGHKYISNIKSFSIKFSRKRTNPFSKIKPNTAICQQLQYQNPCFVL